MSPLLLFAVLCAQAVPPDLGAVERDRVLAAAERYLAESPVTVTASSSPRSAGGRHDYFSEGDYWWPDPRNPRAPYIQRDGMSNPGNFVGHRQALMRMSVQVPALVAAWRLTGDARYGTHAVRHLRAWFVDPDTRMAPHLRYAQAIHGRFTGRGIGIIDTIHLVEVARAIEHLRGSAVLSLADDRAITSWFAEYLQWMTTHQYGLDERDAKNNHGTCWVMQVAAFSRLAGRDDLLGYARERFKAVLIPNQIAQDGSFPLELRRTKPYAYSLFNLDAFAVSAELLSTPADNLWTFSLADGRSFSKAISYLVPFVRDKRAWPRPPDVMYFDQWPMRHVSLLLAARALSRDDYHVLWRELPADSTVDEVIRNWFVRQPLLWVQ